MNTNIPKAYASDVRKLPIDLTLSTNPLGCSPRALRVIRAIRAKDVSGYPDTGPLATAVGKRFRIGTNRLLFGAGSEQLIKIAAYAYARPGSTTAVESGSFFLFSAEPKRNGSRVRLFPFAEVPRFPFRPALLFLANPTTPGGIDRNPRDILDVIDRVNPRVAVIDEANGELGRRSLIPMTKRRNNLIVLRTFSKTLGLAGLRIGYCIGDPALIATLAAFQQPFPVGTLAVRAAETAIRDQAFLQKTRSFIRSERAFLTRELARRGFGVSASVTNNLYVSRGDAKRIIGRLSGEGVSVIDGAYFPGMTVPGFRISLRDRLTNRRFLAALDRALACLNSPKLLPSKEVS